MNLRAILRPLSVALATIVPAPADELGPYGGWPGLTGKATGFFHLEEIDGRNWFVTPAGNVFFPIALSHLYSGESDVAAGNVYGGDKERWITDSLAKARAIGFNCALGSATSPERNLNGFVDVEAVEAHFRETAFPYTVGVILIKHPWEFVEGEALPDIFDPAYKEMIEERARTVCQRYRDDPLVMGYYYGFGAFNRADQWVNHHLSLPPGSPGRDALVSVLTERYKGATERFNRIYGMELTTVSDLSTTAALRYDKAYERRNYPFVRTTLDTEQLADFEALIAHMCVTLYRTAHTAIRRWDRNHLILGSFIKEWALTADSWRAAAPYVDLIAPQHFNRTIDVNKLAAAAGLPIVYSDEYFGFHYPGRTGSLHAGVSSHDARGEIYRANLMRHFKDPDVVGVTYCACLFDQGGQTLLRNNQNGFYDIHGAPREKLIETVTTTNASVYAETPEPATPEELTTLKKRLFDTWDRHSVERKRPGLARPKN